MYFNSHFGYGITLNMLRPFNSLILNMGQQSPSGLWIWMPHIHYTLNWLSPWIEYAAFVNAEVSANYCMPQREKHHIISCAEPCTATKILHLLDNVDSALEAIRFGNFLALLAGNIELCVFVGAFWWPDPNIFWWL